jgi:branched-chain amino acid transport system permease protein
MIGIYFILAYSLNLILGFCGLLSLCHAAFYGIGAYTYTLLVINFKIPFLLALSLTVGITGILAFLVAIPGLRFRGDPFVLVTLGFQVIIFSIFYNWVSLTRGPYGIPGIPRPEIFGLKIDTISNFFWLVLIIANFVSLFLAKLYRSPFGLALKALREDEKAGESLGKSAYHYFLWAFTIGGAIAGIAGALYASYITYIDPTSFTLDESIFQVVILLVGGSGNLLGPALGTIFMILFPEALRFIGLPDTIAPNVRQMIYGAILVILMYFRPQGIKGEFKIR